MVKRLFIKENICEAAELYLLSQKASPEKVAMIRKAIVEIKSKGADRAIKREAKRRLRKLLNKED